MRIALAQLNPTIGDIPGNVALVRDAIDQARRDEADVLVCGELGILGYPPRDLLFRDGVVEACEEAVREIAEYAGDLTVLVGHPRRCEHGVRELRNSVSIVQSGQVLAVCDKRLLPGYDVFDEDRYFDPGDEPCVFEVHGRRIGVLICEDLWQAQDVDARAHYPCDPLGDVVRAGCDVILSVNASPFIVGKSARHAQQLSQFAKRIALPVIAVNQVGANDDLIFDGRSMAVNERGEFIAQLPGFTSAVHTIDLNATSQDIERIDPMRELYDALVTGVRDYLGKTGVRSALIGLSGGIDSAVTAVIAAAAIGADQVTGVMMPSKFSSAGSVDDSHQLAENLQLAACLNIPIHQGHDLLHRSLNDALGDVSRTMTDENLQARMRGVILMAVSNSQGSLVLTTSNKSEIAVGYSTLYGDMVGAVAVLGDVLKTRVYELAEWINASHRSLGFEIAPIPRNSITKPPSAELRPNQTDQDTLPPYSTLDEIIERYVEREQSCERIIAETGIDAELVVKTLRMIDRTEYKREQAALILKVSPRAFGRGRQMPVVARYQPLGARCSSPGK